MHSQVSSRELNKANTEQGTDPWKEQTRIREERTNSYAVPYYSLDVKSAQIEVAR